MTNLNRTLEQINRALGQLIKGADREIAKKYAATLNEIRKELSLLYEKYEQGGILTYAEMAKYNRLDKLVSQIDELLTENYKGIRQVIYDVLGESYLEGYYLTAWAVETDTLTKLSYSAVTPETITKMIENPISGLVLSDRLEKVRGEVVWKIQQEVTQGLVKGETYGTMAKRLKEALEGDAAKALRIVRTESKRSIETAKHDSAVHATKNGVVMMKEWNTVQDERVRSSHAPLDGVKIPTDEYFEIDGERAEAPTMFSSPEHSINCRCFLTYSIKSIEKPKYKELENMTFEAWRKERLK